MSAIVPSIPYVAPWQSEWQRYATQILALGGSASDNRSLTAGDNQWWRPIYLEARITTSSTSGSRVMELQIVPGNGAPTYLQPSNIVQNASVFCRYVFGPSINGYSQTTLTQFSVSVQSIPDMLWPPKTTFKLELNSADSGDQWGATPSMAVEIYTEDYQTGQLVPEPTPLLA